MSDKLITEWLTDHVGCVFAVQETLEEFQTPFQHVEVMQTPQFGRIFRLDGYMMTSEADEWFYHENLNQLPALTHPHPRRALILGGGDGGSARQLLKHASMERVVLCELDAGVVDIAKRHFQSVHQGAFDDPRLELQIGDGLAYVAASQEQFDLIVLDLTDPQGFAEPLYTREFFQDCARLLGETGLLTLHVGSPQFHADRFQRLVANLRAVFPVVRPYLVPIAIYGGLWGMACASRSLDPKALTAEQVDRRLAQRQIDGLNYYNGDTHVAVLALPNFVRRLVNE